MLRAWFDREPGTPERALVQRALDGVYGVDINPLAAAIARFRLLVAALRASSIERLKEAPNFQFHVAVGDSLLHGRRFNELDVGSSADQLKEREEFAHVFQTEDLDELNRILGQQYHVVVGNPPYVTVKDAALNRLYRARYTTCHRQYSLAVPFTERFFGLALPGEGSRRAGFVGVISANSFMKREFGKKLIELFLPTVDLTHVIDTSGAYIPGHGTPTVILFGRHRAPVGDVIRTVMGIRGEPATPEEPAVGLVWKAITSQIDHDGSESSWISAADLRRSRFESHPWSTNGGGAADLKSLLNGHTACLGELVESIGFASFTGTDDAFLAPRDYFHRLGVSDELVRSFVYGEALRDWAHMEDINALVPYDEDQSPLEYAPESPWGRHLWPLRSTIGGVKSFGGKTRSECGDRWWTWYRWVPRKYATALSISFAFVATHNHFVLERGGKAFSRSAPVIKLPLGTAEAIHLALVNLLNCSLACFWMKEEFHNKGSTVDAQGARQTTDAFENFYEYTGTGLKRFPLPKERPVGLAESLDRLAAERQAHMPRQLAYRFPMTPDDLDGHRDAAAELLARMVALQEELDWECYRYYGLVNEDLRFKTETGEQREPPLVALGERAFEIVMARCMVTGELETTWFARHGSVPITELPAHWPTDYRSLVERRIDLIESDRFIGLVERPEYKRRWNEEAWDLQERSALKKWLLNRLESSDYWPEQRLATVRSLAERATSDLEFQQTAARYAGHAGVDIETLVADLVETESVPALPVQRYKPSGLSKREEWEQTWALQRREDEIDAEVAAATPRSEDETVEEHAARVQKEQRRRKREEIGDLAPPSKYRSTDFRKPTHWRLRGALDVPKERFVSLPQMSRDNDPTLLVGWAGWTALDLCQAVATYCTEVTEQDGWTATRLAPLLAVIQHNLPWLKQWHNDLDPTYNLRLGDFFETYLDSQLSIHGMTSDDPRVWSQPCAKKGS